MRPLRALMVEDEEDDYQLTLRALRAGGFEPETIRVWTDATLRAALAERTWDIVLTDYSIPGFGGPQALAVVREVRPDLPVIVISGTVGEETAVGMLQSGASDFITKQRMTRLAPAIDRALADRANRLARARAEEEARRVLDELRERERALSASNAELEQFAYIAAHDLQEPVRMIASYVELIRRRSEPALDERSRAWLAFVGSSAHRMRAMIASLLEYSLIGREGRGSQPVDARQALETALVELDAEITAAGATVDVGPLPTVFAHPGQVERLFHHLVANAVKFRGDGAPKVCVRATAVDGVWRFSVADNGIGIESGVRDRIFTLFHRLHPVDAYPGTGIGLASCKKIVEQHGGAIWLESSPGEGTTVWFTLPGREARPGAG